MSTELIIAIISGLTACVPLVVALINTIKTAKKTKNWAPVMKTVIALMEEAENNLESGATRKEWVMDSLRATAKYFGFDMDETAVSDMIDAIVAASKVINTK